MSKSKRQALIRTMEKVAVAIFAVDVLAYGILVFGLGKRIEIASRLRDDLLGQHQRMGRRVMRLKQFQASLPDATKELAKFKEDRVPSRRQGYSTAARTIREIAQHSGVEVTAVSYKLDSGPRAPLQRLGLTVNAEGLYPSLVHFARALETSKDFIVVREFNFQQGEGGSLALRMTADMYLTP
ncbi:MAG TPA: GspMb/PilO family protein [Terriglobia bacterium]|nr:GspMb/PilO family protein [Terriglobia bacterium]